MISLSVAGRFVLSVWVPSKVKCRVSRTEPNGARGPKSHVASISRARVGFVLSLTLVMSNAPVQAEARTGDETDTISRLRFRFDFDVAPEVTGCPGSAEVQQMVEAQLGYSPFDATAPAGVRCEIFSEANAPRARVVTRDAAGQRRQREIAAPNASCSELVRAAALAMAIAVNPEGAALSQSRRPTNSGRRRGRHRDEKRVASATATDPIAARENGPTPPPAEIPAPTDQTQADENRPIDPHARQRSPNPSPATESTPIVIEERLHARTRTFGVMVGGGVAVSSGYQPNLGVGADLLLAFRLKQLTLGIEALLTNTSSIAFRQGDVLGRMLGGTGFTCTPGSTISICGVLTVGVLRGTARNVPQATDGQTPIVTLGPSLRIQQALADGWSLLLHGGLSVAMVRTTLWIGETAVWSSPLLSAEGGLLAVYNF